VKTKFVLKMAQSPVVFLLVMIAVPTQGTSTVAPLESASEPSHSKLSLSKPHLFFLLADDLGFAELGFQRDVPTKEVATPSIDALVADGIHLTQHFAFKFCSPSRSALQSGRNPIHVNVNNYMPYMRNPADPISGYSAIPTAMTGWGELMKRAGYDTLFAGKWDAGMATTRHTPRGRGYDSSLFYFHHSNDYWTLRAGRRGAPC
jgi:arylsulfatase B